MIYFLFSSLFRTISVADWSSVSMSFDLCYFLLYKVTKFRLWESILFDEDLSCSVFCKTTSVFISTRKSTCYKLIAFAMLWERLSLAKFSREFVVITLISNDEMGVMSVWNQRDDQVKSAWWQHQTAFLCFRRGKNGTEKPPTPLLLSLEWKLWRTYFCQEKSKVAGMYALSCNFQPSLCHFLVEWILVSRLSVVDTYYLWEASVE